MTEAEARAQGRRVRVAKLPVAALPRAKTLHDKVGTWKAVVDAGTAEILGVALLGHNAGEVVSAVQMAMLGGLRYQDVGDAVLTHPTMCEGLNLLFDALDEGQWARGGTPARRADPERIIGSAQSQGRHRA